MMCLVLFGHYNPAATTKYDVLPWHFSACTAIIESLSRSA